MLKFINTVRNYKEWMMKKKHNSSILQLKKIHVAISCSINSNVLGYTTPTYICPEPTPELLKYDNYQIELLKQ